MQLAGSFLGSRCARELWAPLRALVDAGVEPSGGGGGGGGARASSSVAHKRAAAAVACWAAVVTHCDLPGEAVDAAGAACDAWLARLADGGDDDGGADALRTCVGELQRRVDDERRRQRDVERALGV